MYSWFVKNVTLPIYDWHHGSDRVRLIREFERSARLSSDEIRAVQGKRLESMLRHAYEHVPYYRELFDSLGCRPDDFASFEDLKNLPPLRKEVLQERLDDLIADNIPETDLHRGITSGSTGQPTSYFQDIPGNRIRAAAGRRLLMMTGYDIGLRVFYFWRRSPYSVGRSGKPVQNTTVQPPRSRLGQAKLWLHDRFGTLNPQYRAEPALLDRRRMAEVHAALTEFRPQIIISYVNSLFRFAEYLEAEGLAGSIRPRSVVVSSETLYPHQKVLMERVFGCRVFNRYGMQETGIVAVECPEGEGFHTNSEILHVEHLPMAGGRRHRLVVTDLLNRAMPLLRFETGDSAEPLDGPCPCGRGLARIGNVEGRIIELLPTADGGMVSGQVFATFHWVPGIKQYQVIQKSLDRFLLRVVAGPEFAKENLQPFTATIRQYFGESVVIDTEFPDRIDFSEAGKFRLVKSEVARGRF